VKRERGLLEVRGASTAAHCLTAAPSAHPARLSPPLFPAHDALQVRVVRQPNIVVFSFF